jgi:hypothetical protein
MLNHYQFQWAITIAQLTGKSSTEVRDNQGTNQKLSNSMVTSTSSLLSEKKGTSHTCGRLNDNLLHYPEASTVKQACCSLCCLANPNKSMRKYSLIFQCNQCRLYLCVVCFKPLHTIISFKHLKSYVMSMIKQKEEENQWNMTICEISGLTITIWKMVWKGKQNNSHHLKLTLLL